MYMMGMVAHGGADFFAVLMRVGKISQSLGCSKSFDHAKTLGALI